MSATPARCSPSSAWAPRCGRSTPSSSPTTPATATGPAKSTPAPRCATWWTASPRATCCATATRCCPATWATPAIGEAILHAVTRVRSENPTAVYCCDPVIGDDGGRRLRPPGHRGLSARPRLAAGRHRHAQPLRIGTPDRPALHHARRGEARRRRAGRNAAPGRPALRAADQPGQRAKPPATTSTCWSAEAGRFHLLRTPRLPIAVNGAGDAIAALFLFHRLRTGSAVAALEAAGSAVHGLLKRTAEAGSREILTVAAQDEFVSPSTWFTAAPC